MKTRIGIILILLLLAGCRFSKTVEKDLISGMTTKGDLLSVGEVYMTVDNETVSTSSFKYGENVYIVYSDIEGFTNENGKVFPRMDIAVTDMNGDTIIAAPDLYREYTEGMNYSPLQLTADLTVASPIRSGAEYNLSVLITDRKGKGSFTTSLKFSVNKNEDLKTETVNTSFNEIYLFSQEKSKVLNSTKISFEDNIYIIIEGLKGFREENGMVFPGLSLKGTDADGRVILDYADLFAEYDASGVNIDDFATRVSSHFKVSGSLLSNPVRTEMLVWDKKSDAKIKIITDFTIE
jgi:hypothetical protein